MNRNLLRACIITACACSMLVSARAQTAGDKINRGFCGMTLGFLELPGTMCEESRNKGVLYGTTLGFFKGTGNMIAREFVGVYEFVSAPVPWPDHYKPVMQPPYPWDRFTSPKEKGPVPPAPKIDSSAKPEKSEKK
jgi:putative exosortase-associated protein (TIGR04073 family)